MCFHPHSNLTLPIMLKEDIVKVVDKWIEVYKELSVKYDWVQIFENKGDTMVF
jgi:UDPglucose--hexose-1-phosphate uridylyltransferase